MKYCVMWLAHSRLDATILNCLWNILPISHKFDPAYDIKTIWSTINVCTSQPDTLIIIFKVPKKKHQLDSWEKQSRYNNN